MKEKIFALTSVLTLLLTTGIAVAGGPDGTIDTAFYADGALPYFHDALVLNQGEDYVIEKVWTEEGFVQVTQNIDLEDNKFLFWEWADANIDKGIYVDPGRFLFWEFDAHVEKTASWDGLGEVYREAWLGDDIYSSVHAGTVLGDAMFIDNIVYQDKVSVYESVGLNRDATCEEPVMPDPLEMPVCSWC